MTDFTRKGNRLQHFDYSQAGYFFITANARNNEELFVHITNCTLLSRPIFTEVASVTDQPGTPSIMKLSNVGKTIEDEILKLDAMYDNMSIDSFVVMPNHVHMIISVTDSLKNSHSAPALPVIVGQWKRSVSLLLGFSPWQKSFYDHVIRNEDDYRRIEEYIYTNPEKWHEDRYNPGV